MRNRCRTDSGFVRERGTPKALQDGAKYAALHACRSECSAEDQAEGIRNRAGVAAKHDQAGCEVEDRHQRDQPVGHACYALDASEHDQSGCDRDDRTEQPGTACKQAVLSARDQQQLVVGLIDLEEVAASRSFRTDRARQS
jgi:hypothetical protein